MAICEIVLIYFRTSYVLRRRLVDRRVGGGGCGIAFVLLPLLDSTAVVVVSFNVIDVSVSAVVVAVVGSVSDVRATEDGAEVVVVTAVEAASFDVLSFGLDDDTNRISVFLDIFSLFGILGYGMVC